MEDDDEFGDLYTDVLLPFQSSAAVAAAAPPPPPPHRPIDLNLNLNNGDAPQIPNSVLLLDRSLAADPQNRGSEGDFGLNSAGGDVGLKLEEVGLGGGSRVLEGRDENGKIGDLMDKDMKFDIEDGNENENDGTGDLGSDPVIPGLSSGGDVFNEDTGAAGGGGGEGDDWDSDSEDDLQIVLNDNNHGSMSMGMVGEDGDEDGDPLVILGDSDANRAMEEREWGEDGAQAADGELKETGEAGKANGGMVMPPKVGYGNHGYHPFHSQFKYVRPGAAPIPGSNTAVPGGAPGLVRPLVNIGPLAGHGRGEWRPPGQVRPPMQTGFRPGFGAPAWGAGRGLGGGPEFTLPSHRTIFDIDIDGFEEKRWKYPGIEISDFFNFNLNEESWKDYCKQLEQLRLESTMQSKIRVYESGRTEQDYDPDLPPELAAATGVRDVAAENANVGKSDVGQSDFADGSARMRPPLPTGRAIMVETGYGERLPSIDTRPPRVRDSDAIIEIVCQDSTDDDSSTGNEVLDRQDNDPSREDLRGREAEEDVAQTENEYSNRALPFPPEAPARGNPGSRSLTPVYSNGNFGSSHEERRPQGRAYDKSHSTRDKGFIDDQGEESVESMDSKRSPVLSSSVDRKAATPDDLAPGDGNFEVEKESPDAENTNDAFKDGNSWKKHKVGSRVQTPLQETDDGEGSKAARSSENSKARSGSSRDIDRGRDGVEEEVLQVGRGIHTGDNTKKHHLDGNEKSFRRKDVDPRQGVERNRVASKGREDPYPHRDWDPSLGNHLHVKSEGFDRRKERDNNPNPDGAWQRRADDPHNRRIRVEDIRKKERGEEMGSRHGVKARESERSDKDERLHPRKQSDNGNYRAPYDNKDASLRHKERDDTLKARFENADEYHSKRRKDEEYLRKEQETLRSHRENSSSRKRERDVVDPRKRDNIDDHHRQKQSREEILSKRGRDEGRSMSRSGLGAKEEYKGSDKEHQAKDTSRQSEQLNRRGRMEDASLLHHRGREDFSLARGGNQLVNEERRSRQEKPSSRNDRAVNVSDGQKVHERRNKENPRGGDQNASKKRQDKSSHADETGMKGQSERKGEQNLHMRQSSRKHKEAASSDDEQQDSKRGRSKLERWTSHKERDFNINSISKSSLSSLKFKETDANNNGVPSEATTHPDPPAKAIVTEEPGKQDLKDADKKPLDDRHLDTVEKLKKRSERFKLPMPIEKETTTTKKIESEALPSIKSEAPPADPEVKPERPPRKRRWISNKS